MTFKHLQKSGKKAEHARLNGYGLCEGGPWYPDMQNLWAHTEPQAGDQVLLMGIKDMGEDKHFSGNAQELTI